MALAGAGLGGTSIAEAYLMRKIHRETTKKATSTVATGGEDCGGGGGLREAMRPPARRSGRWFFGKMAPKKSSAKVLDLMATE
ncbi:PREDICTED: uncharacterized protein LOC104813635 [Tarenaya hassleriana]|uniref:uncharacterized protein LOC104813635 n=1 Tax=Tarenaya hassleriana TaxID=28532 RepID=UPI00053C64F6|nr:PREDICTED: uncharacterized protein LOC104813635 [Tarenaya hassleriana]